jgi:hypothetical protein
VQGEVPTAPCTMLLSLHFYGCFCRRRLKSKHDAIIELFRQYIAANCRTDGSLISLSDTVALDLTDPQPQMRAAAALGCGLRRLPPCRRKRCYRGNLIFIHPCLPTAVLVPSYSFFFSRVRIRPRWQRKFLLFKMPANLRNSDSASIVAIGICIDLSQEGTSGRARRWRRGIVQSFRSPSSDRHGGHSGSSQTSETTRRSDPAYGLSG